MPSHSNSQYDLTIVGAGPVAKTLGLLLSATGWKIAMVAPGAPPIGSRAIALNLGSTELLKSINAWQPLAPHSGEITEIQVSRRHELAKSYLRAEDIQQQQLGFVIPEATLVSQLDQRLSACSSITNIAGAPSAIEYSDTQIKLGLDNQPSIQSRLLIAADGLGSTVRQLAGLPVKEHDFHSTAICATVTTTEPHLNRAWERFTDQGPIALLPLATANQYSLVFCAETYCADDLMAMNEAHFIKELQQQFGFAAGIFTSATDRYAYPLVQRSVRSPLSKRLILIGSAARHIHPVAGQGLNLALRDCGLLNNLLSDTATNSGDPGNEQLLKHYCQQRHSDWQITEQFTRKIPGLFASINPATGIGRNLAVTAMDLFSPLRKAFIRRATGRF